LSQSPNDAELGFRLAYALETRGDIDDAMKEYQTVIASAPEHVWARNNLGVLYAKRGQYDDAIGKFGEALFRDPHHQPARFNSGLAFRTVGDSAAAARQFRVLLKVNPQHVGALGNLGQILFMQGEVDRAIEHHGRGITTDPESGLGYGCLANALINKCNMAVAVLAYLHTVRPMPQDLQLQREFTQAPEAVGGKAEVVLAMRRFLERRAPGPDEHALSPVAEAQLLAGDVPSKPPAE